MGSARQAGLSFLENGRDWYKLLDAPVLTLDVKLNAKRQTQTSGGKAVAVFWVTGSLATVSNPAP